MLDECIHLVSGVQLAGFRHVVGTLWEVSDWHWIQATKRFYKALLPDSEGEEKAKGEFTDDDVCRQAESFPTIWRRMFTLVFGGVVSHFLSVQKR